MKSEHTRGGKGGTAWCQLACPVEASPSSQAGATAWHHGAGITKRTVDSRQMWTGHERLVLLPREWNADPAPHNRDSQVIQTPPASDPGSLLALLALASLQAASAGRGFAPLERGAGAALGVLSCTRRTHLQSPPHKLHSPAEESRVQKRKCHHAQAPGRSPDTKSQPTGSYADVAGGSSGRGTT